MDHKSKKRDKFKDVAGKRVQYILDKLDLLGNCSNRNNYSYEEEDIRKMFIAIKEHLRRAENKFNEELNKKSKNKFEF
jgi:hypothetical protein